MSPASPKFLCFEQLSLDTYLTKQPTTKTWFDLPFEMREMVIDQMDPKTRCKFAQCSKICEDEAKSSKNYLYGISIFEIDKRMVLEVTHTVNQIDFELEFIDAGNNKTTVAYDTYVDRYKPKHDVKWNRMEPGKPSEVRLKYFKKYIRMYQNSIKSLEIFDENFPLKDHNVKNLKYLEHIGISTEDVIKCGFLNLKQILHAESLSLGNTKFTFDEIIRMESQSFVIKSDEFDKEAVKKYLKMWKNGELGEKVENLIINFENSCTIDTHQLTDGLDVIHFEEDEDECMFRFYANHHTEKKCYTQVDYCSNSFMIGIDENFYE